MYKEETAIAIENLGKMYKLYKNPKDKIKDAFGLKILKKNYFREFWALRDINITIHKGERVGLIGHNGAGKSTLLKLVTGNIEPTEGKIIVNGNIQALLELGTGFHPEFTGRENIRASLAYQGLNLKGIKEIEEEIIDFAELDEYIEQPVKTYSAGMYARLAFATASAIKPELLIIDEVLGAGDAYFAGKCVERMRKLTSGGDTTVLFVSHDLQSVQSLCDRVIWIDKGRVNFDGETLTGLKLYTQSVRKNEEMRLKIRDMKVAQKEAVILDRNQDLYDKYLLRLISESKTANTICKVYNFKVYNGNQLIANIDVGAPMDNNAGFENYIIDDGKVYCWGDAKKSNRGFYREYNNSIGPNKLAPFCMSISKECNYNNLFIETSIERINNANLELQIYNDQTKEYITIAQNDDFDKTTRFEMGSFIKDTGLSLNQEKEEVINNKIECVEDNIKTESAEISRVEVIDGNDSISKVIPFETNVKCISFHVDFSNVRDKFYVALSVYSMRGDVVLTSSGEFNLSEGRRNIDFEYSLGDCKMGTGEYLISIGIYDKFDPLDCSREQKFLALIDRGVSFKIEKPLSYNFGLGFLVPNAKMKIKNMYSEVCVEYKSFF